MSQTLTSPDSQKATSRRSNLPASSVCLNAPWTGRSRNDLRSLPISPMVLGEAGDPQESQITTDMSHLVVNMDGRMKLMLKFHCSRLECNCNSLLFKD